MPPQTLKGLGVHGVTLYDAATLTWGFSPTENLL